MKLKLSIIFIILFVFTFCSLIDLQFLTDKKNTDDIFVEPEFSKQLTISISFWNIQDLVNAPEKDDILKYIEKKFNIVIKPIAVSWNNYLEQYQILSATKSLPDIFASLTVSSSNTSSTSSLKSLISSGAVRSLPNDLSAYENLNEVMNKYDYIRYLDGKHYVIPRVSFEEEMLSSTDAAMLVRKDWMQALGLSNPESLDEFIDMICAFAKDDPDGNHINDTIGYNVNSFTALGKWVMLGIAPECNVFNWIQTKNGYLPSYLTDDFKKVVVAYRTMYERGGLDPDFYTKNSTDVTTDFARGYLGALEYKSSPGALVELETLWNLYQDKPFEECVTVLPIFPAEDGIRYSNSSNPFWSESLISSSVDDEKMERILSLFEYLLSEEGRRLIRYGLEGIDYTIDEEGTYHCLVDTKDSNLLKTLENKYPSLLLFTSLASWGGDWTDFELNEMNTLRYGKDCTTLSHNSLYWNIENTITVDRPYEFILLEKEYSDVFNKDTAFNDFIRVIIGKEDPLTMWNEIIDGYYKNGLSEYLKRQNK